MMMMKIGQILAREVNLNIYLLHWLLQSWLALLYILQEEMEAPMDHQQAETMQDPQQQPDAQPPQVKT